MNLAIAKLLLLVNMFMPGAIPQGFIYSGTPVVTGAVYTYQNETQGDSAPPVVMTYTPHATGDRIIIDFSVNSASATVTCSDNATGGTSTYTYPVTNNTTISGNTSGECQTTSVKAGVTTITVGASAGGGAQATLRDYSYTGTPATQIVSSLGTNTGTALTTGSVTTVSANGLISCPTFQNASGVGFTATGSYTKRVADGSTAGTTTTSVDQIVSATGVYACTGTLNSSQLWTGYAIFY